MKLQPLLSLFFSIPSPQYQCQTSNAWLIDWLIDLFTNGSLWTDITVRSSEDSDFEFCFIRIVDFTKSVKLVSSWSDLCIWCRDTFHLLLNAICRSKIHGGWSPWWHKGSIWNHFQIEQKQLLTGGRPEEVWLRRKILGIFFVPHFGCSTTGIFREKLQFRKRFAIAKPRFSLQFPLERTTSVETAPQHEISLSMCWSTKGRPESCHRARSSPSSTPPTRYWGTSGHLRSYKTSSVLKMNASSVMNVKVCTFSISLWNMWEILHWLIKYSSIQSNNLWMSVPGQTLDLSVALPMSWKARNLSALIESRPHSEVLKAYSGF